MNLTILLYILLAFVIIVVVLYYLWYVKQNNKKVREIPFDFILTENITIIDIIEYVSNKYGHYIALDCDTKKITYKNYYDNIIKFSNNLSNIISQQEKILIITDENKPEIFYAFIGCMMSGCIPIICNSKNYHLILNKIKPKIIILNDDIIDNSAQIIIINKINKINNNKILFDNFINLPFNNSKTKKPDINDIATIIYDENNKENIITHKNIIAQIKACISLIKKKSNIDIYTKEKIISYMPLKYITSQMIDIYISISIVATVHFSTKNEIYKKIKLVEPTIFIGSANLWQIIYTELKDFIKPDKIINKIFINKYIIKKTGLDNIKIAITTSPTQLNNEAKQFYIDLGFPLFNSLILNEASGLISLCLKNTDSNNCMGYPLIDVKIHSKTNEIMIKGDTICNNYNNKKWFKTGYRGYIDRDGSLYVYN